MLSNLKEEFCLSLRFVQMTTKVLEDVSQRNFQSGKFGILLRHLKTQWHNTHLLIFSCSFILVHIDETSFGHPSSVMGLTSTAERNSTICLDEIFICFSVFHHVPLDPAALTSHWRHAAPTTRTVIGLLHPLSHIHELQLGWLEPFIPCCNHGSK